VDIDKEMELMYPKDSEYENDKFIPMGKFQENK
jgi:hypothetical protein